MLSHMSLEENLHLDDQEVDEIFNAIDDFVSCLETLHPNFFTPEKALDIKQKLVQVGITNHCKKTARSVM